MRAHLSSTRLRRCAAAIACALLSACGGAAGSPAITVSDVRAPAPAGPNGAVYLILRNDGDGDDRLVAAASDVADRVEIHESTMRDGTVSMRQVDGVGVPAGGDAVLEAGGFHIMLVGVRDDLAEDDTFELTLSFAASGDRTVTAEVVPLVP